MTRTSASSRKNASQIFVCIAKVHAARASMCASAQARIDMVKIVQQICSYTRCRIAARSTRFISRQISDLIKNSLSIQIPTCISAPPIALATITIIRATIMANERPGTMTPMALSEEAAPEVPHIGDHDSFPDLLRKLSLYVPPC